MQSQRHTTRDFLGIMLEAFKMGQIWPTNGKNVIVNLVEDGIRKNAIGQYGIAQPSTIVKVTFGRKSVKVNDITAVAPTCVNDQQINGKVPSLLLHVSLERDKISPL